MPPPSVEAANTALRLDPDILPPLGSVVAYVWDHPSDVRKGIVLEHVVRLRSISGSMEPAIRLSYNEALWFVLPKDHRGTIRFLDYLVEIISLPEECPQLSEWLRGKKLLGQALEAQP